MLEIPIDIPYTIDMPIFIIAFENATADIPQSAPQSIGVAPKPPIHPPRLSIKAAANADKAQNVLYIPQKTAPL